MLGWYSTAGPVAPRDVALHKRFTAIAEAPVFLLMDAPRAFNAAGTLPVQLFESSAPPPLRSLCLPRSLPLHSCCAATCLQARSGECGAAAAGKAVDK